MKNSLKILIHSIFWIVFVSYNISFTYSERAYPLANYRLIHLIINTIWAITIFYFFYFHSIKYFEKGKLTKYLLFSIISSIIITFLFFPIHKLINPSFDFYNLRYLIPPMVGSFIIAQCGSLVKGFENWVNDIKHKAELENQNLKNELDLLKSQINPHFLFNTINNIDTLIRKAPDEASNSLIALSDMLRYMIYETNNQVVPLDKELEYIQNFIRLQKHRYSKPDFLKIDLPGDCQGLQIAPLLLLPFIENAFKFVATDVQYPAIELTISCNENLLMFSCKNYFNSFTTSTTHTGGVGLENVKRRLELIYKDRYTLNISKNNGIFHVELNLELA